MFLRSALAALTVTASVAALPLAAETVTHAQGTTEIASTPERTVVFDLPTLDNFDALGLPVAGAPSSGPAYLEQYRSDVGTLFEPDLEVLSELAPDLIIVGGRSAAKYADVAGLAPTIDMTIPREGFLDAVRANLGLIGRIYDREAAAAELIASLDGELARLNELSADAGRVLVVLTTGGRMSAHGVGSRFNVIYEGFGFTPAVLDLDTANHGQAISHEFILEANPDWLFVVDRDAATGREGEGAAAFLDNELVHNTTAWSQGQVVYLDPADWYLVNGGIQSLRRAVAQLTEALEAAQN